MQQPQKKTSFLRTALLAYVLFLAVFAVYAYFEMRGNRFLSPDAASGLVGSFCLFSVPWWLFAGTLWCFKNRKHWGLKAAGIAAGAVSLVAAGVLGVMMLTLATTSATNDPQNYLRFDSGARLSERAVALFPEEIPSGAGDARYYYSYSTALGGVLSVQGTWTLPEAEYEAELERILLLMEGAEETVGDDGETVLNLGATAPDGVRTELYAAYLEQEKTVSYYFWQGREAES